METKMSLWEFRDGLSPSLLMIPLESLELIRSKHYPVSATSAQGTDLEVYRSSIFP